MLWLFARLATEEPYDRGTMLAAAEHGYRFLYERMLDPRHGGFYWEVDEDGGRATCAEKHLYGHAFALYALSQYAIASGRADVLKHAGDVMDLLESTAHDAVHGGYRESFLEDWSPVPPGQRGCMGPGGLKRMNTHLHLLEAMAAYYRASGRSLARERLLELVHVLSHAVVRTPHAACTDRHELNWQPQLEHRTARVSYGHDLENVWLLIHACEAAGMPTSPLHGLFRALCAYALRFGFDSRRGGFYLDGPLGRRADRRQKVWWVQAEALIALLRMWRLTREPQFLTAFERTWAFVDRYLIDREHGEWHTSIAADGRVDATKGGPWKAGYHTGRAMLECLAMLHAPDAAPRAEDAIHADR